MNGHGLLSSLMSVVSNEGNDEIYTYYETCQRSSAARLAILPIMQHVSTLYLSSSAHRCARYASSDFISYTHQSSTTSTTHSGKIHTKHLFHSASVVPCKQYFKQQQYFVFLDHTCHDVKQTYWVKSSATDNLGSS